MSLTDDDWERIESALAFRSSKLYEQGAGSVLWESCYAEARTYGEIIPRVRDFRRATGLFSITPLKWDGRDDEEGVFKTASTPFGSYSLECEPGEVDCKWGYCFDEYYDEESFNVGSLQEGMDAAWAHWVARISGALTRNQPNSLAATPIGEAETTEGEAGTK